MCLVCRLFMFQFLLPCFAQFQNGTRPVKLTDLRKIRSAGSVTYSEDGEKIAFPAVETAGNVWIRC